MTRQDHVYRLKFTHTITTDYLGADYAGADTMFTFCFV